jgi:hypothetical protein
MDDENNELDVLLNFGENLVTPEWTFTRDQLYRFKE